LDKEKKMFIANTAPSQGRNSRFQTFQKQINGAGRISFMSRGNRVLILLAILLIGHSSLAQQPEGYGTSADSTTISCITAGCGGGGVFPPGSIGTLEDNPFGVSANTMVQDTEGAADAHANLVDIAPGLRTLVLTGQATGSATGSTGRGGSGRGDCSALQGYIYSGPPTTLTVTADLSGTFSGPISGQNSALDGIFGRLYLFMDTFSIEQINFEVTDPDYGTARLGCIGECYVAEEEISLSIGDGDPNTDTGNFEVSLDDGDSFYLYATFVIAAAGGGSATSLNSFEVSFDDITGLSSELEEVPDFCGDDGTVFLGSDMALPLDCYVNGLDYSVLADQWMENTCVDPSWCDGADIDESGSVDDEDLILFAEEWLACSDPEEEDCDMFL
jgi:hypothetical protein